MSHPQSPVPPALQQLQRSLGTRRYGRSFTYSECTGSTNDDARDAHKAGAGPGHIVVADAQTAGRGSRGRSWESPAGTDLYVSIVDSPGIALVDLPPLTLAVGLAVAETADALLQPFGASQAQLKWPNDVLIGGKKCAGILIEASTGLPQGDSVVIGIGLNVNRTQFPPELADIATSLHLCSRADTPLDRWQTLQVLLEHVEQRVDAFIAHGAAATVRALAPRLSLLGQRARCDATEGVVRGVHPSGALLFETAHGVEQIVAGRLTAL